jgi:hypothetical protein
VGQLFTQTCTNQTTSWLVHSWNTFGARMNHKQTWTHKTHHNPDLKETTTFPLIVFSMHGHQAYTQMSFFPGIPKLRIPKFSKLGLSRFWRPITFCANLRLRWSLKENYSFCQELFNDILHVTFTQVNQDNYWLLVVGNQIGNLTPNLSFGHNLCFEYPNGSCEPILDIYVPRTF